MNTIAQAHLAVINEAVAHARKVLRGTENKIVALDLLKAAQAVPKHISRFSTDNETFIKRYYQQHDDKWGNSSISLIDIYYSSLSGVE